MILLLAPWLTLTPMPSTMKGFAYTDVSSNIKSALVTRQLDVSKDLIFASRLHGKLTEVLVIKANGEIILRGKKVARDPELGKVIKSLDFGTGK